MIEDVTIEVLVTVEDVTIEVFCDSRLGCQIWGFEGMFSEGISKGYLPCCEGISKGYLPCCEGISKGYLPCCEGIFSNGNTSHTHTHTPSFSVTKSVLGEPKSLFYRPVFLRYSGSRDCRPLHQYHPVS